MYGAIAQDSIEASAFSHDFSDRGRRCEPLIQGFKGGGGALREQPALTYQQWHLAERLQPACHDLRLPCGAAIDCREKVIARDGHGTST